MKNIFLLFCLFIYMHSIYAQDYKIEVLGLEEGLSSSYITSMTQDKDGFLWIATESGLNRFDGKKFISFSKQRNFLGTSINCNELNKVYADPYDNIIWIATQREGLNALNYNTGEFIYYTHDHNNPESIVTNDITDVTSAKDGNLWIATYHKGVDYFDKKTNKFIHYRTSSLPQLVSNQVWTIKEDNNSHLYMGHVSHGLTILSLKDNSVKNYMHNPLDKYSIPGNTVRAIYIDNSENIWIGTNNGLALFNPETEQFTNFRHKDSDPSSLISNHVFAITQMNNSDIYVGTQNGGVSILNIKNKIFTSLHEAKFTNITAGNTENQLTNSSVTSIFQDSFNNIWIGTYGGGVNFIGYQKPLFNVWKYNPIASVNSLSNPVAWGICADDQDNLWIGTDGGGIDVYKNGKKTNTITKKKDKITDNAILSGFKDSRGNLWFGTYSDGINFYSQKEKRITPYLPQLKGHDVRHFFEDRDNNLWISTHLGLYSYNLESSNLTNYHVGNSPLEDNLVRAVSQDSLGRMWIGTFGQGLIVTEIKMNLIKRMKRDEGLYSNTINHIYTDAKSRVWVATGEGLALFKNTNDLSDCITFTTQDGLTNDHIRAITGDSEANIWISTNNGLNRIDAETLKVSNYTYQNGVPLGVFMNASVTKTSDGKIYFGSQNGLCYFDPLSISATMDLSPVVINSFALHNTHTESIESLKTLSVKDHIFLLHNQNTFQVSFNSQNYAQRNIIEYAYQLKGLDDKWMTLGIENSVTFRNIPPGDYQLQVKARIKNQDWSNHIETLDISITPPFWLTWWAKIIYAFIMTGIIASIAFFYRRKLYLENSLLLEKGKHTQEQQLNDERLRFYTNITHELRTPLTLIIGPLDDLQKDISLSLKHRSLIGTIQKSSTKLLNLINQILEFRKTETQNKRLRIEKGDITELIKDIVVKYKEGNTNKNLTINIDIDTKTPIIYFDSGVVDTIVDNLISNAIKYTSAGEITVFVRDRNLLEIHYTEIEVKDTGTGISQNALNHIFERYYREQDDNKTSGSGIGLALVYSLVQLHQGNISVESQKHTGSSFFFRLETDNTYPSEIHINTEEKRLINVIEEELLEADKLNTTKPIVLVVEDNEDIRSYLKDTLCDYYEVLAGQDGINGLELAQHFIPDIIVSDIMMPEMDGIEMCKQIKKDIRTSHIPVILLTAKDSTNDRTEGYDAGADSYIVKPINSRLLHSRITNLLEARQKMAEIVSENVRDKGNIMQDAISAIDNDFLEKVTENIKENLDSDKIDIAFISNRMNMSHSTFYRKIKALTGKSANEYVRKIRILSAEELLLSGKYTISEVSFMVGFNSLTYFRQCFKDEYGLPPSEYVKYIASKIEQNSQ